VDAVKVEVGGAGGCGPTPSSSGAKGKWKHGAVWRGEVWRAVGGRPDVVELRNLFFDGHTVFIEDSPTLWSVVTLAVDTSPDLLGSGLPRLLRQMLLGVEACHQASVVHRDVKPDNYLICPDGGTVKLCDFNSSALLPPDHSVAGEFGTAPFMSPEMLTARHGISTDLWSYGVMAYFMFFGELPYIPEKITSNAAKAATRAGVPVPRFLVPMPRCSSDSMSFCRELLQRDPSQRCSAKDALGHSYLNAACDLKKDLAMPDTQSTLDPFESGMPESDEPESDEDSTCSSSLSQQCDSDSGQQSELSTSA
jgi:serine/threonine protein kinase